ncbi:hypothetical protein [Stenomitos frigidus]|uniref:Replication origin-binding protein domain-containing protein n=1 Tax=Stenomitos frigidus ULC18 TaxID=2107698 RepID=A0A2T1EBV4_9CYAN|nr:hypothetical protein [Stenomitos frigidus]PSB30173.1 hypothetical protein C7B82_09465 [Stenomitos frigidus ULC18]
MNTSLIPQGLSDKEAFKAQISTLQPKDGNSEIWFKLGHNKFYVGNFSKSGRFLLWETVGQGKDRKRGKLVGTAFEFLREKSQTEEGGVFYNPTQPIGLPVTGCVDSTDDIGIEMDSLSTEDQLGKYELLNQVARINYASLLSSGGRSIHAHIKADQHLPLEQANYLRRLAIVAFMSDPVTERLHQPMRIAGFYRKEKNAEQRLLSYSSDRYTYEELVAGFRRWFAYQGWAFPETISDIWWKEVLCPIFPNHKGHGEAEKAALVKAALEVGQAGYEAAKAQAEAERQQRREQRKQRWQAEGRSEDTSLSDAVKETCDRLGKDAFELYNHNWQFEPSGEHARGRCHWHDSTSGTSAYISGKKGTWGYVCPACTNEKRIDAFTYWRYATYGKGAPFPRGKEYVEQAKAFLSSHGVEPPVWHPQQSKPANVVELHTHQKRKPGAVYTAEFEGDLELLESLESEDRKQAQEEAEQRRRDRWREETERIQAELNGLRVEPTIRETGRYIPKGLMRLPDKPGIILVDGTMGVGKTATALKDLVGQHRKRYPLGLEWLFTPRNLLGLQSGNTLGLPHRSTADFARDKGRFRGTSCFESIGLISPENLPNHPPLIVVDEAGQAFKQVTYGDTCKNYHAFVIERTRQLFREVAMRGGWIVLSEDGLTNLELDFVREASGLEVVEHLKFTRQVTNPRSYYVYDSPSITGEEILIRLDKGENLVVTSDSQRWLAKIERWLQDQGFDCVFITSENSQEDWAHKCIKNPTEWLYERRPRVFGYSPTMGSGVSIDDDKGYFSGMAFHFTHLEPREAKQLCDRLRTDVPRFGYICERAATEDDLYSGSRPDLILRDLRRNKNGIAKLIDFASHAERQQDDIDLVQEWQRLDEQWNDHTTDLGFYLRHYSRYKAREAYGKTALRDNLMAIWENQGHEVTQQVLGRIDHIADDWEAVLEQLDREKAMEWAEADTSHLTPSLARSTLNDTSSTRAQRLAAKKCLLEDKLPGAPLSDVDFALKAVIAKRGRFLKTTEMLWLSQHPEAAQQINRWDWLYQVSTAAKRNQFVVVHRLSVVAGKAKLLHECPLHPFIDGNVLEWDSATPEAIAVHEWALLHARQFRRYLRLTITPKHTPTQTVNKLLRKLGYEADQVSRKGKRGDRECQYTITNREDIDREIILKALTERFLSRCEEKQKEPSHTVRAEANCDYGHSSDPSGEPTSGHAPPSWFSKEELDNIRQMWDAADCEEARSAIRQIIPQRALQAALPALEDLAS